MADATIGVNSYKVRFNLMMLYQILSGYMRVTSVNSYKVRFNDTTAEESVPEVTIDEEYEACQFL